MKRAETVGFLLVLALILGAGGWAIRGFLSAGAPPGDPGPARDLQAGPSGRPVAPDQPGPLATAQAPERVAEPTPSAPDLAERPEAPLGDPGTGHAALVGRVLSPQKTPLDGATVELMRGAGSLLQIRQLLTPMGMSVVTDTQGRYRLEDLAPAEDYCLVASHPEFGDAEAGPFTARSDQVVEIPDLELRVGARVFGTVLVAGSGRPIAGAVLTLTSNRVQMFGEPPSADDPSQIQLSVTSTANGTFEFRTVPIPSFEITVAADSYGTVIKPSKMLFGGGGISEQEINFELGPAHSIAGMIVDDSGRTLEGAEVSALITNAAFRSEGSARSDRQGRFEIKDLAEGSYYLSVNLEGFSQGTRQRVASGTGDLVIELQPQGGVTGTVVDEKTGAPVPSFELTVMRHVEGRKPARLSNKSRRFRDSAGSFQLDGLDPNEYVLEGRAPGYAPSLSGPFHVVRGKLAEGVVVALNRGGSIRGVVLGQGGKPVAGAEVQVNENNFKWNPVHDLLKKMAGPDPTTRWKAVTGADGSFLVELIVPETYQIAVRHQDHAPWEQNDLVVEKGIDLDLGRVQLTQGALLEGFAYDENGNTLPGAQVQAHSEAGDILSTRTDNGGHFVFIGVRPGSYDVSITDFPSASDNFLEKIFRAKNSMQKVHLQEGNRITVKLELQENTTLASPPPPPPPLPVEELEPDVEDADG